MYSMGKCKSMVLIDRTSSKCSHIALVVEKSRLQMTQVFQRTEKKPVSLLPSPYSTYFIDRNYCKLSA